MKRRNNREPESVGESRDLDPWEMTDESDDPVTSDNTMSFEGKRIKDIMKRLDELA